MAIEVDILEDYIYNLSPDLLTTLFKDHTTRREGEPQRNIFCDFGVFIKKIHQSVTLRNNILENPS